MIKPLNIATSGYLCNTLSIAVDGYLCPNKDIDYGDIGTLPFRESQNKKREKSYDIIEDDNEILLFIKIFTRWL